MTSALGATFAAAMRMVDRIHRGAAHVRAMAQPAIAAGLADDDGVVFRVANRPDGRPASRGRRRISPLGRLICAQSASRAASVALTPAERHITPPRPG